MRWQGRRQSDNVEDQRGGGGDSGGQGGGFGGGGPGFKVVRGGGLSGILILVVMFFVLRAFGIDPIPILFGDGGMGSSVQTQQQQSSGRTAAEGGAVANDEMTQFARTVLAETEDVWSGIFQSRGQTYTKPTMVLFTGQVRSACASMTNWRIVSARRVTLRRPMCWRMKSGIMSRTCSAFSRSSTRCASR
jgi:predicted metalloprotease